MGKIIDRVRARQDLIEAREREKEARARFAQAVEMADAAWALYEYEKRLDGEVMLMCNRGDEVQH